MLFHVLAAPLLAGIDFHFDRILDAVVQFIKDLVTTNASWFAVFCVFLFVLFWLAGKIWQGAMQYRSWASGALAGILGLLLFVNNWEAISGAVKSMFDGFGQ